MEILKLAEKSSTEFEIINDKDEVFFQYQYLKDYQVVIQKWFGYLKDAQIIHTYKQLSYFAIEKKHQIKASISDIRQTKNSFHLTNKWVAEELLPKSIPHGYRYAIFVKPDEFFAELALEDAVDTLSKVIGLEEIKVFDTLEGAIEYAKNLA